VKHVQLSDGDAFTNEVDVDFDVLHSTMMDGVAGHVDRRNVAERLEFTQELAQPGALCSHIGYSAIFDLGPGPGHRRLALAGP
jgi:hypothetical protein